ncbi:Retinoblastoma-associated protein A-box, partial [Trinorchestia longiramus]
MDGNQSEEEKNGNEKDFYKEFQDLVLDLNLDQATADEAWSNYETLKLRYVMEGCQMYWVACSVYFSCRQRKLPTVGGRPGTTVQGNCISLTRLLHFCNLTMVEFIRKMRLWLKMTHLDSDCVEFVDTLERKFAVSNNIYRKYRPIFLDLFVDPENDVPRPVRSRKQRKPPCNATELYQFSWTLYILVKARYPGITQDLVMSYFLLLSCIDLIYVNVKCMSRTDLLNPTCEGYPKLRENKSAIDVVKLPESIMDYLCRKFEGVVVETKVVRDYYWKPDIRKLVETKLLKGSTNGLCLLECQHFDHNVKEVRNAYEANLLTSGEFDDRMFLTNDKVLGLPDSGASSPVPTAPVTPMPHLPKRGLMLPGDYHLMPQTPLSGRQGALESPCNPGHKRQYSPLAAAATALQRLYSLINGRTTGPSPALASMLARVSPDPMPVIQELLTEMGTRFCKLYCEEAQEAGSTSPAALPKSCSLPESQSSEDSAVQDGGRPLEHCSSTGSIKSSSNYGVSLAFAKMRLKTAQMLFFTFLENIIQDDETKRGIDIN